MREQNVHHGEQFEHDSDVTKTRRWRNKAQYKHGDENFDPVSFIHIFAPLYHALASNSYILTS